MKTIMQPIATTIGVMLCLVTLNVTAQDQKINVGAGVNKSHINGSGLTLSEEIGGYVKVGSSTRLGNYMAMGADLQFIQHHNHESIGDERISFNTQAVALSFFYKVYPVKQGLNFYGGFQAAFITKAKVNDINVRDLDQGNLSFLAGAGYDFGKYNVTFQAHKYVGTAKIFDSSLQLGVAYTLN